MSGKIIGGLIVGIALAAGAAIYYLQVYAFYDRVSEEAANMRLTLLASDAPEAILVEEFEAIDGSSSPLRFRACFRTPLSTAMLTETYVLYEGAEPLVAPSWFDCFDAAGIGAALEEGRAIAFLGERNITQGIDRVVAVLDNGQAYAWHQLNEVYRK